MSKIDRIKELVQLLNKVSDAYYNTDRPIISDVEFDKLYGELQRLEKDTNFIMTTSPTINVGFEIKSKLDKTKHSIPLLSLNKTKNIDELNEFIDNKDSILMYKGDGLTHELIYNNGELQQSSTRGNGYIGDINTFNARTFKNIPLYIKFKGYLKLSGEAVILNDDFEEINSKLSEEDKYSNSRNLVAGSVRQLDAKICANRNVRFYAFSLIECQDKYFKTLEEQFEFLENLGFDVIDRMFLTHFNKNKIQEEINILRNKAKRDGFPIDGIVAAYNNLEYANSLGNTAHHPLSKLAFKFMDEEYITKYIRTEWQISRTGLINPVGVFEPIEIDGAVVTRATLHNIDYFKALELGKGDKIHVIRANMVIPKIVGNDTKSNTEKIPDECPICGTKTEIKLLKTSNVLYCTNNICPSRKIAQFSHFVSRDAMNIIGLSEKSIEKFINLGFLKDLPDIYKLEQYKDQIIDLEGFGEKSYDKLIESINNSKQCNLANFIFALGIQNVGKSTAKLIANKFGTIQNFINAKNIEIISIKDIGDITTQSILEFRMIKLDLIIELLNYITIKEEESNTIEVKDNPFKDKKIYCTGTFAAYKKKELKDIIEKLGGNFANGYAKSLDMLIIGSIKGSSKEGRAKKDGVKIIYEDQFLKMIGGK